MLTDDKKITTPQYWNAVYSGNNLNAKVDSSNTKRTEVRSDEKVVDRFDTVARHAEGPIVLDIASGHAHICKRIMAMHHDWIVTASDQAYEARTVANYSPYMIFSAYDIPWPPKSIDTIICTQAMEYMDDQEKFILEAKRVGRKLLITVPKGEMSSWSQLRIYTPENLRELLEKYGTIEVFEEYDHMILAKIKFYD